MTKNNTKVRMMIVMLLALTILIPSVIKVTHHHSEELTHKQCSDKITHVHSNTIDFCDICSLTITSFNHSFYNLVKELTLFYSKDAINKEYSFCFSSFTHSNNLQRGPPKVFS